MGASSSTRNYLTAIKNLEPLSTQRLYASGLELIIKPIGEGPTIANIQIDGEAVDSLKSVINCSIARILTFRKALLKSELSEISAFLGESE